MARKRATLSDLLNDLTFRTLYDKYRLIAMNAFKWNGLPCGIKARHIERELFAFGKCIFFRDPEMSYMALHVDESANLNVYEEPLSYIATGFNYHKRYKADDVVIIENNLLKLATDPFVMFYVNKLTEAERTMDVNVRAVKTPIIFACDDKDVLSFKRLFQQVDGNIPAIFADKNLNIESINSFDTKAQFLCNDLMNYKKTVENELLTFLGQNNTPHEKKERLITDEANSNNQLIESFFELQFAARKEACKQIKEKFDIDVTVEKRVNETGKESANVTNETEPAI